MVARLLQKESAMDGIVTAWINRAAGSQPMLDGVAIILAGWGVQVLVLAVVLTWWAPRSRSRSRHLAIVAGLAFLLGEALNQLVLQWVHRPRPYDAGLTHLIVPASTDWSFPSDHATAVAAIAAAFLIKGRRRLGTVFAVFGAMVALARVYVGIHYLGDILGGMATGVAAAVLVAAFWWRGNALEARLVRIL